jgi:DNA ligase-1
VRFSELALYLGRLEETSSRNALVGILAELFGRTPPEDVAPTCYLLQGRLAPFFEPIEIGLGQNYVADAVARAYGGDRAGVLACFDELGDLGDAAAALAAVSPRAARPEDASPVREVFDALLSIARTSGVGSVGAKVEAFASLLAGLDPHSVRYLCRIPLGRLRLGIGDPTVLDGFSFSKVGDRSLRKRLERGLSLGELLVHLPACLAVDGLALTAGRRLHRIAGHVESTLLVTSDAPLAITSLLRHRLYLLLNEFSRLHS